MHQEEIKKLQAQKTLYQTVNAKFKGGIGSTVYLEGIIKGLEDAIEILEQMDDEENARQAAAYGFL